MTNFETIWLKGSPIEKTTYLMYSWLQFNSVDTANRHKSGRRPLTWPLQMTNGSMHEFWHISVLLALAFKIDHINLWLTYITPAKLNAWHLDTPDTCWRSGDGIGAMLHIWWDCPLLLNFWKDVFPNRDKSKTYTTILLTEYIKLFPKQIQKINWETSTKCGQIHYSQTLENHTFSHSDGMATYGGFNY